MHCYRSVANGVAERCDNIDCVLVQCAVTLFTVSFLGRPGFNETHAQSDWFCTAVPTYTPTRRSHCTSPVTVDGGTETDKIVPSCSRFSTLFVYQHCTKVTVHSNRVYSVITEKAPLRGTNVTIRTCIYALNYALNYAQLSISAFSRLQIFLLL
jgi:hypothetical protein